MRESEEAFVARRQPDWSALQSFLDAHKALHRHAPETIARVASLYRSTASDLTRARGAGYSPDLVRALDQLAARAHAALYAAPPYRLGAIREFLRRDFPETVRRHARAFWIAATLFVFPGISGFVLAASSRQLALQILPAEMVASAEQMYARPLHEGRSLGADTGMAGFYIYNNVGIAFRCFALGILFGLGSVFVLVYNGLVIGAFAGLVTSFGHGLNLLTFVCGHGAFELTAIVISGAAGLVMGYALVDTGGLRRWASLRARTRDITILVLGAALMLILAAVIEGFWSPSPLAPDIKLPAAAMFWLLVIAYLALAGKKAQATGRVRQAVSQHGRGTG